MATGGLGMSGGSRIATSGRCWKFNGNRWSLLLAVVAVLPLWVALSSTPASAIQTGCTRSGQTVKCVYNNNEDAQFTVPPGITSVAVDVIGATGGGNTSSSCAPLCGGKGANVSGPLSVSPGEKLDFEVASNASNGGGGQGFALNGSFAAGGGGCWGGGGASAIWQDGSSTALAVAGGGGGNGCPGMGGDPATQGGNADAAGAAGANAYDGRPGSVASGAIPGAGGAGGQPINTVTPITMGFFGGAGSAGNFGGGGQGGFADFAAGQGGGGGGGLGGGGGGGGGGDNSAETVGGSGGGGGGGSSLVPAGGSRSLDTTRTPGITISFVSNLTFTSPAPPAARIGSIYDYKYAVVGDTEITYSVAAGSLPPGFTLSQTGELEGVAQTAGTYAYTVAASDGSATVTRRDTIAVTGASTLQPSAPVAGKTANASLAWGVVLIKLPNGTFAPLGSGTKSVPLGSTVDASKGGVKIETSTRTQKKKTKPAPSSGKPKSSSSVSTGTFSVGIFSIEQARERSKLKHRGSVKARATQVKLRTAKHAVAKAGCQRTGAPGKGVVRAVHGVTKGDYQIVGASSVTSVTNATWTVEDLCDGTLTTLQSGRATVTSMQGKVRRAHHLRAGQSLLIKGRFL
jgi:hypothetical protein